MSDEYPWRDKERLERLYIEEDMTQPEIAEKWDCGATTVSKWLRKFDIKTRTPSDWKREYPQLWDEEWLREKYQEEGLTAPGVADIVGCSENAVLNAVEEQGIPKHSQGIVNKTIHPSFDYNRGYMRATAHNYDDGEQVGTDTIRVHRLVAVAKYGFDALKGKVVHHKNGVKWDNRPCNLEIMAQSEHMERHHEQSDWDFHGKPAGD